MIELYAEVWKIVSVNKLLLQPAQVSTCSQANYNQWVSTGCYGQVNKLYQIDLTRVAG